MPDESDVELSGCSRVVLYGGSFDPPHVGHMRLSLLAGRRVDADVVAYLPTGRNPTKSTHGKAPAHHRLAMLRLALAGINRVVVLTHEIQPAIDLHDHRPNYTVQTLKHLRRQLGDGVDLRLLMGGDNMRQFYQWRDPEGILRLVQPLVMVRPPDTRQDLLDSLPINVDRMAWGKWFVDLPPMDVSSSQIRRRIAQGRPITGLVRHSVEAYIHQHRLYV